jgi:pimeloyl-ACP methyl ester carboxylesterase
MSGDGELVDVGGYRLWIRCEGAGSPTVVFEAGLGSGHEAWSRVAPEIADRTRVCVYDRAGIGRSEPRPETTSTPGAMADELARLLEASGIAGPVVLVGHSYGGMVVQLAADRYPALVDGVVLVDSSSGSQFEEGFEVTDHVWNDGPAEIDKPSSIIELADVELGAIPLVVLTQDGLTGDLGSAWARYQRLLASLSTTSVHLTATGAGHGIQDESPALVIAAVAAVLEALAGGDLPPCTAFEAAGGACFEG